MEVVLLTSLSTAELLVASACADKPVLVTSFSTTELVLIEASVDVASGATRVCSVELLTGASVSRAELVAVEIMDSAVVTSGTTDELVVWTPASTAELVVSA